MSMNAFAETAVLFTSEGMGQGGAEDRELRLKLATNYLRTLLESGQTPRSLLLYAGGVKLVTAASPCLAELTALAEIGVPLVACRTCLDFYGLLDQVRVGEVGNMARIVEEQGKAAKVVTV